MKIQRTLKNERIDFDLSINISSCIYCLYLAYHNLQRIISRRNKNIMECFRTGVYYGIIFLSSQFPIVFLH